MQDKMPGEMSERATTGRERDYAYALVVVDISHEKVDRPFTYRVPDELRGSLVVGMPVIVPFGRGDRQRTGYVIDLTDEPGCAPELVKELLGIKEDAAGVESRLIRLAAWMRTNYGSTMIQALKTVLPARRKIRQSVKRMVSLKVTAGEAEAERSFCERRHQTAKSRALSALLSQGCLSAGQLRTQYGIQDATLLSLEKAGLISITTESCYRNPVHAGSRTEAAGGRAFCEEGYPGTACREESPAGDPAGDRDTAQPVCLAGRGVLPPKPHVVLSQEQREIVEDYFRHYDAGDRTTCLLHGITGSGKTEVYMALIEGVVARGRQAVLLIPEIALTYQTVNRFYQRFGNRVSVMNSTLSEGEKYDQCMRAKNREIDVIIGPRSALFTPFPEIGLILIDEEHETSYKSEQVPKYHARETAEELARLHGAAVFLGSATPSMESYYRARTGRYRLYRLTRRMNGGALPTVYVEDLRRELREGNRSILSRRLKGLIEERLSHSEQTMLFLNRRGYAGFLSCRMCGTVMKCPHCEVSLSEHKNGTLVCHYCGYTRSRPRLCPDCGSPYLMGMRAGTEQIEEQLVRMFPQARVLRMDADTTRKKDDYERILSSFAAGEADILVGTQMIVKGHDFPNVTLMGVVAADLSLNAGDYRAGERTFQLLTQAAGRAGRGSRPGEVVIQTYQPEHYSIVHAAGQDYEAFYQEEILYRTMAQYPPVGHLLAVQITSGKQEEAKRLAERLADLARTSGTAGKVVVIGPAPAAFSKINDVYRYAFYLKSGEYHRLVALKDLLERSLKREETKKTTVGRVQFDFEPMTQF